MHHKTLRLLLLAVLVTGAGLAFLYRDQFDPAAMETLIEEAGIMAPILFMALYAVAAVLLLPGSVLTLLGGALFGPLWGTLYNLTGATLGAGLAFLGSRYLAAGWVADKSGGRLKQLINGVEAEGWRFVAFVRLVPLFPFNLLNYAIGLTRIPFSHYFLATWVCMLPGAFAYTYLGYAGREAIAGGEGLIRKGLLALALIAVVAFLPRLIGAMRKGPMVDALALKHRLDAGDDLLLLDVRTPEDFNGEQGHIPGAVNLPVEELDIRIDEILHYQQRPVITICRTDRKSGKAAQLLAQKGFADVHVARMGMTDWNAHGYPVAGRQVERSS